VKVSTYLRLRPQQTQFDGPLERVLVTRNRAQEGLGLALPAGKVALFGQRNGRRILLGEGRLDDYAVGEKVEVPIATSTGVRARQVVERNDATGGGFRLVLTNDLPSAQEVRVELPLGARSLGKGALVKRDGWMLWQVTVPANGTAEIRYRV
jgi:hypothetical protein